MHRKTKTSVCFTVLCCLFLSWWSGTEPAKALRCTCVYECGPHIRVKAGFRLSILRRGNFLSIPSSVQQGSPLRYSYTEDAARGVLALYRSLLLSCPLGQAPGFTCSLPFSVQHQRGGSRSPELADLGTKASSRFFHRKHLCCQHLCHITNWRRLFCHTQKMK